MPLRVMAVSCLNNVLHSVLKTMRPGGIYVQGMAYFIYVVPRFKFCKISHLVKNISQLPD